MEKRRKTKNGFTLIELLVVISIVGILSSVAMTTLNGARAKARDARRRSDLDQIALAMDMYYVEYRTFIVAGTGYRGTAKGWFGYRDGTTYSKSIVAGLRDAGFFKELPLDPDYVSEASTTGQYMLYNCGSGFCVYAKLEKPTNTDKSNYTAIENVGCPKNLDSSYGMNYVVCHK